MKSIAVHIEDNSQEVLDELENAVERGAMAIGEKAVTYVKDNIDLIKEAESISLSIVNENIKPNYVDFNKIKSGIRDKVGKYFYQQTECKPMILIVMQEV